LLQASHQIVGKCQAVDLRNDLDPAIEVPDAEIPLRKSTMRNCGPFGLKSSQLGLLVAVTKAGPARRIELGRLLSLDPSTLTCNLAVMLRHSWIEEVADDGDQRDAPLQTTATGRKLLPRIAPPGTAPSPAPKKVLESAGVDLIFSALKDH
jgi:DNA-binding MarR family transcriptional regulator